MADQIVPGIDSREKLQEWLRRSGIHFIVFDAQHFVAALTFDEIGVFQQLVGRYEEYTRTIDHDPNDEDWAIRANTPRGGVEAMELALPMLAAELKRRTAEQEDRRKKVVSRDG